MQGTQFMLAQIDVNQDHDFAKMLVEFKGLSEAEAAEQAALLKPRQKSYLILHSQGICPMCRNPKEDKTKWRCAGCLEKARTEHNNRGYGKRRVRYRSVILLKVVEYNNHQSGSTIKECLFSKLSGASSHIKSLYQLSESWKQYAIGDLPAGWEWPHDLPTNDTLHQGNIDNNSLIVYCRKVNIDSE